MAILVYLFAAGAKGEHVDTYPNVEAALGDLRLHWNEEETGGQLFVLTNEDGDTLATIMRGDHDPEIAITTYPSGILVQHRCHYVLEADGRYTRTEITQLPLGENQQVLSSLDEYEEDSSRKRK